MKKIKRLLFPTPRNFNVKKIYLFGSSLDNKREANDIDLAIRGVSPILFFDFDGHWNTKGHLLVAGTFYNFLGDGNYLESK